MTETDAYGTVKGEEEHILILPGNRQLVYAHNGPVTSRTVVLFFTGLMSVGTAPRCPAPCAQLGVHWIAPTLPGMGNSSTTRQKCTLSCLVDKGHNRFDVTPVSNGCL